MGKLMRSVEVEKQVMSLMGCDVINGCHGDNVAGDFASGGVELRNDWNS